MTLGSGARADIGVPTLLFSMGSRLAPGLILAVTIACAAKYIASISPIPAVLGALTLGMVLGGLAQDQGIEAGLAVAGRQILRLGVALLGVQITLPELVRLGRDPFIIAVASTALTLLIGYGIARALGLRPALALLTAGAVGICGASAALAIAAVLTRANASEDDAAVTVAAVTVIGTIAMIVYPLVAMGAGLGATATGVFLGASLHEVVQAVGAGFSLSDHVGETATAVKLVRVACLAPVIMLMGLFVRGGLPKETTNSPSYIPLFLLGFVGFATIASLGILPGVMITVLAECSRWCLIVAIAALGVKLSLRKLVAVGPSLILAILGQSLVIASIAFVGVRILQIP